MMLGGKLCKGPMQKLWQCKAYINTPSTPLPAALGKTWPSELVRPSVHMGNLTVQSILLFV